MTRDEIIRMAREAGVEFHAIHKMLIFRHSNGSWIGVDEELERFAALVAAAEREECAKVCEAENQLRELHFCETGDGLPTVGLLIAAEAIRARGASMTDKQPEALRLADAIDYPDVFLGNEAAAELRRLHEVNAELVEALRLMNIECQHLHHAKKDQHGYDVECPVVVRINVAIAKATGEQQ